MDSKAQLANAIIDSASDYAIISTDLTGVITSWNTGAEKILGWSEAEALGSNVEMIFTPEDQAKRAPAAEMQKAQRDGRALDERRHMRNDGSRFFASGELMPLRNGAGDHVGYVKLLRDYTKARQMEERLAASEASLRLERDAHRALIAAQAGMSKAGGIDASLDAAVRGALGAIPAADGAAFVLLLGEELMYRTVGGSLARLKGLKLRLDASLSWRCVIEARPLVSGDTETDNRVDQAACARMGARSIAVVPVFHQGEAVGVLLVKSSEPNAFADRDVAVAQLLAGALVAGFADQASAAAARAVRESEQRFRATFENAAVGVAQVAPDGAFIEVNRRFCDIVGYTKEELGALSFQALTHPEDLERNLSELGPMLEGEVDAYSTTKRYLRKDGGVVWANVTASCTRTVDGQVDYIIAIVEDVSAQKQAEEALQRSRERLSRKAQLLELSHDAVIVWEPHGRGITYLNRAAEELYGYTREEALGRVTHELLRSRLPAPAPEFDALLEREGSWSGELVHTTRDGREITVDSRHVVLVETDGRAMVLETNRDITERKAAEAALQESERRFRELAETLEQRVQEEVAERTSAEEQLRQAQKMEAIGQLTGGIAHDFNNLLTGITGSLEMMRKRAAEGRTQDVERYLDAAMTSANRAAALTHRLLAFARRQPLDPKSVDANELVSSMDELLRRTLGEHIELQTVPHDGLWRTLCDPNQLEAAILNLAINARDAMAGGGKLTIETCNAPLDAYAARQRDVRPGDYVCICITDTGSGMPREVTARAFEPFFTTKPAGQGTGLGLSMIYGFARQSGGYARIYSEVGQGTTVKLYLPRYKGQEASEGAEQSQSARLPAGDGQVVLVVEDEPSVADLAVEVLRDLGYRPIGAKDGPSGLSLVRSLPQLDLLVTDIGLPGLNGPQLAEAARRIRPKLKVLFMTGYAEKATLASGLLDEQSELITKPFPLQALASRVHSMLATGIGRP